jgi:UDP-glucose 4-epimerase
LKILVTGGAGFIGSHVADTYIGAGHHVVIVDDLSSGNMKNVNPKAKFVKMDIRGDELRGLFESEKFDVVNHHAAQMDVRRSVDDPLFDASVNVVGSLNLLENSKRFGVKRFVFASTGGAIYGEQDYFPADEEHPQRPLSPYGISKLAVEKYLFYYMTVHGLQYTILRYANVYGPRQNPHGEAGVVAVFSTRMLSGKQPVINGDGRQTRDYVNVKDLVRANLLALSVKGSEIVNIGTGIETDVNDLFRLIMYHAGKSVDEVHGEPKKGEQLRSVVSNKKAERILGWKPTIGLSDGIKDTVEFFRQQAAHGS